MEPHAPLIRIAALALPYPISANRYWASRMAKTKAGVAFVQTYVTPEARAYRTECGWIAKRVIRKPITGRVHVHAMLYPHRPEDWRARQRKHGELWDDTVQCIDLGNCEKVMSDALQGIVFADDCQIRRILLERMEPDEHGARLQVFVYEATPMQRALLLPQQPTEIFP